MSTMSINTCPQGARLAAVDSSRLSALFATRQFGLDFLATLFTRLKHVWVGVRKRQAIAAANRRAMRHLHELDDHLLRDIGLLRTDLSRPRVTLSGRLEAHAWNLHHGWGS